MDVIYLEAPLCAVSVAVSPARGAEICSILFNGTELVYRALDFSNAAPGDWYGHGQLLWPAVGRHLAQKYAVGGKTYSIPIHGFAKDKAFTVIAQSRSDIEASVTLQLTSTDADCIDAFPFPFELTVKYVLDSSGRLNALHTIRNTGSDSLPFAIGNHISLNVGSWEDCRLKGTITHQLGLTGGSLLDGTSTLRSDFSSPEGVALSAPGVTDGVFAVEGQGSAYGPCEVTLEQPGRPAVTLTNEWAEVPSSSSVCDWVSVRSHRLFVLWGLPPEAGDEAQGRKGRGGFLCPEPWVSGPDSLNTRLGLPVLAPGEQATWLWTLSIKK